MDFTVTLTTGTFPVQADTSDAAVDAVLLAQQAPFTTFVSVYQDNPVPDVHGTYGAPMGRSSRPLDADGLFQATPLELDEGYDDGGAYWGLRPHGVTLFAVQDGMGNVAFFDAANSQDAISQARVA